MRKSIGIVIGLLVTLPAFAQVPTPAPAPILPAWTINQATQALAITPTNSAKFPATKGLYIGDASACTLVMKLRLDTSAQTWSNIQPGSILPIEVVDIEATSTTCTVILALY